MERNTIIVAYKLSKGDLSFTVRDCKLGNYIYQLNTCKPPYPLNTYKSSTKDCTLNLSKVSELHIIMFTGWDICEYMQDIIGYCKTNQVPIIYIPEESIHV